MALIDTVNKTLNLINDVESDLDSIEDIDNNNKKTSSYTEFLMKINACGNEAGMDFNQKNITNTNNKQDEDWNVGYNRKIDDAEQVNRETKSENPEINVKLFE